jgi:hypothetical protein
MHRRFQTVRAAGALLLSLAGAGADAETLLPGTTVGLSGATVAGSPWLAGTIVEDRSRPFAFVAGGGSVSGELQDRVVKAVDGSYDFYWKITVDAGSAASVHDLYLGNFTDDLAHLLDASFALDGVGSVPAKAAMRSPDGSFISFDFSDGVGPGQTSFLVQLDTQATAYAETAYAKLGSVGAPSGVSTPFTTWSAAPVPEPASYALMLAGAALLMLKRRARPGAATKA